MEAVHVLSEEMPGWVTLPLIFEQPHADYLSAVHYRMAATAIPVEVLDSFATCFPGRVPVFYTDGGCQHPQLPSARHSAYAIVLDFSESADERSEQVNRFHATQQLPTSLKVVAQGRVPGLQNVYRAELLAIVLILEATPKAICYTDSQLSVDAIQTVRQCTSVHELQNHPQFDLIVRVYMSLTPHHDIRKVRAHQDIPVSLAFEEAYIRLGNRLADQTASCSVQELMPSFTEDLQLHARGVQQRQDMYKCFLEYIVALQTARAQASQGEELTTAANQGGNGPCDAVSILSNWTPTTIWPQPESWDLRWVDQCAWGIEVVDAAFQYLQSCQWPEAPELYSGYPIGITWIEIALELMYH
eukprot:Skav234397  [mRNA]  locus=scaffold873:178825:179898:- [translate_table: standard]